MKFLTLTICLFVFNLNQLFGNSIEQGELDVLEFDYKINSFGRYLKLGRGDFTKQIENYSLDNDGEKFTRKIIRKENNYSLNNINLLIHNNDLYWRNEKGEFVFYNLQDNKTGVILKNIDNYKK